MRARVLTASVAVAVAVFAASAGVVSAQAAHVQASTVTRRVTVPAAPAATPVTVTARTVLTKLTVRGEPHAGTYARTAFKTWIDADRDRCDTRKEVLIAESTKRVTLGQAARSSPAGGCPCTTESRPAPPAPSTSTTSCRSRKRGPPAPGPGRPRGTPATPTTWTTPSPCRPSRPAATAARAIATRSNGCRLVTCAHAVRWVAIKYRWSLTIDAAEQRELARLLAGTCGEAKVTLPARGK
jgi:hypothetical protein